MTHKLPAEGGETRGPAGWAEWLMVAGIFFAVTGLSALFQAPTPVNQGRGNDGAHYYAAAEAIRSGRTPEGAAPNVYRLGTPFLAAHSGRADLLEGFYVANGIGNAVAVILLCLWLRRWIKEVWVRVLLIALYCTQPLGPLRFMFLCPAYVEPWGFVALLALWLAADNLRRRPSSTAALLSCSLLSFIGVFFRESVLLVPVCLIALGNPVVFEGGAHLRAERLRKAWRLAAIPVACGAIGIALTHRMASPIWHYSFAQTAARYAYEKPLLTWLHAWGIVYGPLVLLAALEWRRCAGFLQRHQMLGLFLSGVALLSWIGGADTERLLYWSVPVVAILEGKVLVFLRERLLRSPEALGLLVAAQSVAQRLFWPMPDAAAPFIRPIPALTPIGDHLPQQMFYAWHALEAYPGSSLTVKVLLAEYVLLFAVFYLWRKASMGKSGDLGA